MLKTYTITGMHCQACVARLTDALKDIDGVDSVDVSLDPPQAKVEYSTQIDSSEILTAISSAGDYSARELSPDDPESSHQTDAPSKATTYYPLILIIAFLVATCAIVQFRSDQWSWSELMSDFMGGFFVVFAFFKLLDLRGFARAFQSYDIIAANVGGYGLVYPFIELALGTAYLMRFQLLGTNVVTLVVMLIGSVGVLRSLLTRRKIQCACLGTVFDLPMSTVTLVEDLGMAAMAAAMIAMHFA